MNSARKISNNIYLVFLSIFLYCIYVTITPKQVYAYVDFGTGSYFLQIVIGVLLGGIVTFKAYKEKIILFIKKIYKGSKREQK